MSYGARSLILQTVIYNHKYSRNIGAMIAEITGLAEAINLNIIDVQIAKLRQIEPSHLIGKGKRQDLAQYIAANKIELLLVNGQLSPIQQRNLERDLSCKVIDRTALILEIFGERAQTREGMMQVELASLEYQKSRLVRSWTHLERQRGGFGFMGGPGERQIESDRRVINDRIASIKRDLQKVTKTRNLHRKARDKVPFPIVALVGYTNAGKSTLFNRLTGASVLAEDALFATLDPTMRKITLPSGKDIILSDTVGFISDLPTELIAAFRATLEEVQEADLILHIRDISNPDHAQQKEDVEEILSTLVEWEDWQSVEAQFSDISPLIQVLNKSDLIDDLEHNNIAISAITGSGIQALLEKIDQFFTSQLQLHKIALKFEETKKRSWLYEHGQIIDETSDENGMIIAVSLSKIDKSKFDKAFA